jgi:hypothetical protein
MIILHFTLETITTTGSPANMVYDFLKPFFPSDSLLFKEIKFNLRDEDVAGMHADEMEDLARVIAE